jgi:hypothetical protein
LPVVLYGCEAWSLTLREEQRRRVSEEDEMTGDWRGTSEFALLATYQQNDQIKDVEEGRACSAHAKDVDMLQSFDSNI